MPIHFEELPGEAIVVYTFEGDISANEMRAMLEEAVNYASQVGWSYHIADMRESQMDFKEAMRIVRTNSVHDQAAKVLFVGANANLVADMMKTQGLKLPVFRTLDDAITFARHALAYMAR
jgi:hypothetical protein